MGTAACVELQAASGGSGYHSSSIIPTVTPGPIGDHQRALARRGPAAGDGSLSTYMIEGVPMLP